MVDFEKHLHSIDILLYPSMFRYLFSYGSNLLYGYDKRCFFYCDPSVDTTAYMHETWVEDHGTDRQGIAKQIDGADWMA